MVCCQKSGATLSVGKRQIDIENGGFGGFSRLFFLVLGWLKMF